ncbi:MAG: cyclic nucleotide-binding domain-containing protein [Thiomargarita sp.]|nr:cyclic nucleotide-binding domain-containing protein [Thiomargarita sp.]
MPAAVSNKLNSLEKNPLEKIIVLSKSVLFSMLKTDIILKISKLAHEETHADKDILFSEGDIGDKLFLIVSGKIDILKATKCVGSRKENDFMGELSIFDAKTRTASARCVGACTFLVIGYDDMERLIRKYPDISMAFLKVLIGRMREMVLTQNLK